MRQRRPEEPDTVIRTWTKQPGQHVSTTQLLKRIPYHRRVVVGLKISTHGSWVNMAVSKAFESRASGFLQDMTDYRLTSNFIDP